MTEFLGKVYKYSKSENDDGYTDALGLTSELKQKYINAKPDISLLKNGDGSYTLKLAPIMDIVFNDGKEFDEVLAPGVVSKSTITLQSNSLKHVQKHPNGKTATITRQFGPTSLVTALTVEGWSGKSVREYIAA